MRVDTTQCGAESGQRRPGRTGEDRMASPANADDRGAARAQSPLQRAVLAVERFAENLYHGEQQKEGGNWIDDKNETEHE